MLPRFIGLCGHPRSGKSEVQKILTQRFGVIPIDDGLALRKFAADNLPIDPSDPFTQEGKMRTLTVIEEEMTVRQFLGELGNALEKHFGEYVLPYLACQTPAVRTASHNESFSFGSVRKTQGHYYKKMGGIIIQVDRHGVGPSGNAFDLWDYSAVDIMLRNNGDLQDLEATVIEVMTSLYDVKAVA